MGKIVVTIIGLLLSALLPLFASKDALAQFPRLPGQASTQSCESMGITFNPSAFPENYPGSLTFNFQISNNNVLQNLTRDGGKRVWMHFGFGPRQTPVDSNQITISRPLFTLTLPEDSRLRSNDPHNGSLHWQPDSSNAGRTEELCSQVNYRIGTGNTCRIINLPATLPPAPGNTFDLHFEAPANQEYDLLVGSTEQSYQVATTDSQGRGVFNHLSIPGRQDERVQISVRGRNNPVLCQAYTTITTSAPLLASPSPTTDIPRCDIIQMPSSDNSGLWITNSRGGNTYRVELDGRLIGISTVPVGSRDLRVDLGPKPPPGNYPIRITHLPLSQPSQEICPGTVLNIRDDGGITISNPPAPGGATTPGGTPPAGTPAAAGGKPCDPPDPTNPGFQTAIGCIHTSPAELVKDFMTFIVGISGGLAFLMMLLGAFQMLTSAGNPETLATGKDRFTNAIIGLLFVIFAVLLLQIIGFDILRLPGFNR